MTLLRMYRHRSFSMLWFAGLISLTGDWLLLVALPIYVFQLTGSPVATSAVVAVNVAAALVVGAVAGVLVDRWDRRRMMLVANLLQAVLVLPLVAVRSERDVWIVLVVMAAQSTLRQFMGPAEHALLPRLVPVAELPAANSLNALNNNIARLGGPALGGIVAATTGLAGAALLDGLSFLLAAALIALIGGAHRAEPEPARPGAPAGPLRRFADQFADGLRTVRSSAVLRALFAVVAVTSVGEGIMASTFPVFVSRGLGGGASEIGWLMSAQAVGGIVGGLASTVLAGRIRPIPMTVAGLVTFGAIDLAIFNYPRLSTAIAPEILMFIAVGVPGAMFVTALMTLLQTEVTDSRRGRVFAAAMAFESGAALIGSVVAATLTDRFGVINVLTAQGAGYVLAGVAFWLLVRGHAATMPESTRELAAVPVRRGPSVDWNPDASGLDRPHVLGRRAGRRGSDYSSWQRWEYRAGRRACGRTGITESLRNSI